MSVTTEHRTGSSRIPGFGAIVGVSVPELELVEKRLHEVVVSQNDLMQRVSVHILEGGGKRLRPLLVILAARLFPSDVRAVVEVATASELIHMASLIHDDIIDGSDCRHKKPSLNSRWGNHLSVLFGDHLFAAAFRLLAGIGKKPRVISVMAKAVSCMCEGEFEQMSYSNDYDQSEGDYLRRIRLKTAELIAASCVSGALLSEMPEELVTSLYEYGICLGCAFQIVDDVLDFTSDPSVLGKPTGSDLKCGTVTLPLLNSLTHPVYGQRIREMLRRQPLDEATIRAVSEAVKAAGGVNYAHEKASAFIDRAKRILMAFPKTPPRTALEGIADYVLTRAY
ncbi:MAG TPA: polyprenyl synthetase family protein [Clostridia bacterium]|nr:polyprenyl synthetase family protein [Clostridia bacterium]